VREGCALPRSEMRVALRHPDRRVTKQGLHDPKRCRIIFQWMNVALGTGPNIVTAIGTTGKTTAIDTVTWTRN